MSDVHHCIPQNISLKRELTYIKLKKVTKPSLKVVMFTNAWLEKMSVDEDSAVVLLVSKVVIKEKKFQESWMRLKIINGGLLALPVSSANSPQHPKLSRYH